jgi:hypothetical protein
MPLFAKPASDVDESFEDQNKRAKIMLIVLAAVVVIAALFWFLVKPGSTKSDSNNASSGTSAPGNVVPAVPSTPSARPTVKPTPRPTPTASFRVNDSTRDPFAQLAFEIKPSASPSPSAAPTPSATADPSATPSPAASTSSAAEPSDHTLTLLSVTGTSASLSVDGKTTDAKAGATIASGVVLVKITDDAVFVTFDSKAYAITIGQTVKV